LYLTTVLGFDSSYSHHLYDHRAFINQYWHGVYAYRILGRELVLATRRLLDHFGLFVHTTSTDLGQGKPTKDLFTAFVVVNGAALLTLTTLLYVANFATSEWALAYVTLVVLIVVSGYVVTPYDNLSYLWITASLLVVMQDNGWAWFPALLVAIVGTATRESFLVAVAASYGMLVARGGWRSVFSARDAGWWSTFALGVGFVSTYATLHWLVHPDPTSHALFMKVPLSFNWNSSSVVGVIICLLGAVTLYGTWPRITSAYRRPWRRARLTLWILSSPYLAACVLGGIWFEAPRLLMPLFLCEFMLRQAAVEVRIGS
jgi:hypothetical protein